MEHTTDTTIPEAFWSYFVDDVVPLAEKLSGGAQVSQCTVVVHAEDQSGAHIGALIEDLDRWFRWTEMLAQHYRTHGREVPPSAHGCPLPTKELTFELTEVVAGSIKFKLEAKGKVTLAGIMAAVAMVFGVSVSQGWMGDSPSETPKVGQHGTGQTTAGSTGPLLVPEPGPIARSQMRAIAGVREGSVEPVSEDATVIVVFSNGEKVACNLRLAARQVDRDGLFMVDVAAACLQLQEQPDH